MSILFNNGKPILFYFISFHFISFLKINLIFLDHIYCINIQILFEYLSPLVMHKSRFSSTNLESHRLYCFGRVANTVFFNKNNLIPFFSFKKYL
jgi:hypothetical protein